MASIFLSYVVILEKLLEGFSISGRREPGSTRFRRPEAMATVLHPPPIIPGLWTEGQRLAQSSNSSTFFLYLAYDAL